MKKRRDTREEADAKVQAYLAAEDFVLCERHRGYWTRQRCHDLAATTTLCGGCAERPQTLRPSAAAQALKIRMARGEGVRGGAHEEQNQDQKLCKFDRLNVDM